MRLANLVRPRPVRAVVLLDGRPPHAAGSDVPGARTLVVLDDTCERLERVASEGMGPGPTGRWQRRSLLRSLRAAEASDGDAIELLALGRNATAESRACLVRTRATPEARAHLDALAAEGARLVSVTTVARLLARVYRRHPVPRLFVARTDLDERHVLVVDGVACFSRTVVSGDGTTADAVAESLEHLAGRYAAGRVDVAGIGLDDGSLDACRALAHVGEVRHVSRTDLATTLARRLDERAGSPFVRRRTGHVPALPRGLSSRDEVAGVDGRRRAAVAVAALASCLAVGSVGRALATLVQTREPVAALATQRAGLEVELASALAALRASHERPLEAATSLARADALDAGGPLDAEALLALVATALRDHDAIRLDAVAWALASPHERDAAFTDASSLPRRVPQVPSGLHVDVDSDGETGTGPGAGLDVELAGHVTGATGVGAAERAVDGFAAALAALPGVGAPVRLDSPLERAAGGALVGAEGEAGSFVQDGSAWRLRFAVSGRSADS